MTAARPGPPRAPKPFGHVPLATGPLDRAAHHLLGHQRYAPDRLAGHIAGTLEALTPVHIGTGRIERTARVMPAIGEEAPPLVYAHLRVAGTPVLPGSALKGTVRAVVEAITDSCLGARGRLTTLGAAQAELEPCPRRNRARDEQYCLACRLFGALGYAARLHFADAFWPGATQLHRAPALPPARAARPGALPGRRFYQHGAPAPGPVPLEVCPPGARFPLRIDFHNLAPAELGVLLVALGQAEPAFCLKLGGYKPACLGSVRLAIHAVVLDDPRQRALAYVASPDGPVASWTEYVAAAFEHGLIDRARLQRLAEILRYPREGPCPSGPY
jgi:CRISPR/Cas system CSM-associated protein Csm3 (group 7 of RAMP superfamily)